MELKPVIELNPSLQWVGVSEADAATIARRFKAARKGAIWLEGFDGAGKSAFGMKLAAVLAAPLIDLDHFLPKEGSLTEIPSYRKRFDLRKVRGAVASAALPIVAGVCLRDVLGAAFRREDAFVIYVARCSRPVIDLLCWNDGLQLEEPAQQLHWLEAEILRYHLRVRPHIDNDQVVVRLG